MSLSFMELIGALGLFAAGATFFLITSPSWGPEQGIPPCAMSAEELQRRVEEQVLFAEIGVGSCEE